ncbi:uncharacterized protein K02A2.6-like [Corticium candelabrum]|uniref:uncharacterized protein K02A2.6-like n=1 Tax=Corticium candelabrum TaxID=121492 RepID=UPI002E2531D9|nr:uncharacterized protein K02A2.6-like [Corticium candelabrum]
MTPARPITTVQLRQFTDRDEQLATVRHYVLRGWPREVDSELRHYWNRRHELSVLGGCVLWGSRVIIPQKAWPRVLEKLHVAHPGVSRMKSLARSYIWWPGLDADIEKIAKSCGTCQEHQRSPPKAPLHSWAQPERAWSRLHIDFDGPFLGRWFVILSDAYSKWLEVKPLSSPATGPTIQVLQSIFATHGLPEIIDNGLAFTSQEFGDFMKSKGIVHITTAPYYPSSTGLAERAVQTFKEAMKRM